VSDYGLLNIKKNSQFVHLELQSWVLHVGKEIARQAEKFSVSYKSSRRYSVFIVTSPGRH